MPLIEIAPPADLATVHQAWHDLHHHRLVMVVSPGAAQAFVKHRPPDATWPAQTWIAAPGPASGKAMVQALTQSGIAPPSRLITPPSDAPQFDSEHLWPQLADLDWAGQSVLIISGGKDGRAEGRAWLTEQWLKHGAKVATVVAYGRQPVVWSEAQSSLARQAYQAPANHCWLLSSSQAVDHLVAAMGQPPRGALAMATHPRIAETAKAVGFSTILTCAPRLSEVCQTIEDHCAQ